MKKTMNVAAALTAVVVSVVTSTSMTAARAEDSAASTSAALPPAAAAASSTASLDAAKADVNKRPWHAEVYNSTWIPKQNLNNLSGTSTTINFVGLKSTVGEGKTLGVRQLFNAGYPTQGNTTDWHMSSTYIHYTDTKLAPKALAARDIGLTSTTRLYLPTGESDRFLTHINGKVRQYGILSKSIGKVDLSYVAIGDLYSNTQDSYIKAGKETANTQLWIDNYIEVGYNFTSKLSVAQDIGLENTWKRQLSTGPSPMENSFNLSTGVAYQPIPELTLAFTVSDDHIVSAPTQEFAPYRDDEITGILEITATL